MHFCGIHGIKRYSVYPGLVLVSSLEVCLVLVCLVQVTSKNLNVRLVRRSRIEQTLLPGERSSWQALFYAAVAKGTASGAQNADVVNTSFAR